MDLKRWVPLFVVGIILGVILRISLLVTFILLLFLILSLATWWQRRSLDGVNYQRKTFYKRAFPDEIVPLQVEIENRKILPLTWLRVQDPWPKAVGPNDEEILAPTHLPDQGLLTNVFSLRWYERARRQYTLKFRKRGKYKIGPVKLESGDLFGIYEKSEQRENIELLTVFPELISWTESEMEGIKYFSGTGTYKKSFEYDVDNSPDENKKIFIDLGDVQKVADTWLNGEHLGITWAKPHRFVQLGGSRKYLLCREARGARIPP